MPKRGQVWSLDLMVSLVLFLAAITLLLTYAMNQFSEVEGELNSFYFEGASATELLLSETGVGIMSDGMVNQTRLDSFAGMGYTSMRSSLGVNHDFYFTIPGLQVSGVPTSFLGLQNSSSVRTIIVVDRVVAYRGEVLPLSLYIWEEEL